MTILQTIELKKYYGSKSNITRALDGVTLSIEQEKSCAGDLIFIIKFNFT